MKYLWVPHIVILATLLFADEDIVGSILAAVRIRSKGLASTLRFCLPFLLAVGLFVQWRPTYQKQMEELKEFWDPDTVRLPSALPSPGLTLFGALRWS